ncbi:hypothetical protein WUBG_14148 [Wuchereria bancrofti]|uniref:Uncharacterized protein n=1 Tax=Wuchereria bancrofti TaxID=6293 RepID=J9ED35_WUCBA|nr:hypothetical protein WUBG_14148 [Wuchereria bancrofti]
MFMFYVFREYPQIINRHSSTFVKIDRRNISPSGSDMSGVLAMHHPATGRDIKSDMNYRRSTGEPLKRFAEAKTSIGDIYNQLETYVTDLLLFYNEILNDNGNVPNEQMQEVARFKDSVKTIRDMFMRDTMKVVFSEVINAMLHAKVLPQGMGHTTCCFLQVEGSPDDQKFVLNEDSSERMDIEQLQKLGHAMSDSNVSLSAMGQDSLYTSFIPNQHRVY